MQINRVQLNLTRPVLKQKESNKLSNVTFEGNKTKVFMGAGSALAAAALFSLSKNDGVNSSLAVEEFYKAENSGNDTGLNLKRFSEEERYEIQNNIDEINIFPEAFRAISRIKLNDTDYRFNGEETIALFQESAKEIEEYPKVFAEIAAATDENNEARFSVNECVILMNNAKYINNDLFKFKLIMDSKNEDGTCRYDANECIALLKQVSEDAAEEVEPEDVKPKPQKLPSLLARVREDNSAPIILDTGEVLSKEMTEQIRENRYCYGKKCRDLIKLKNEDGTPRFTEKEVCELLAKAGRVMDEFKYVTVANADGTPFFTNEQSQNILLNSDDTAAEIVFAVSMPDGSMRFTQNEYVDLLTTNKGVINRQNADFFIAAASMFDKQGSPVYSAEECTEICKNPTDYPDVFEKLIEQKNDAYETNFKVSDFEELGLSYKSLFYHPYDRNVYSDVFNLRDKYNIETENIKPLIPFIENHKKEIWVVPRRTFARFLEANIADKKFDIENMEKYLPNVRKFNISQAKMDIFSELKSKNGLSTDAIAKLIITD